MEQEWYHSLNFLNRDFTLLGTDHPLQCSILEQESLWNHIARLLRGIQCQRPFKQAAPAMSYVQLHLHIPYVHSKVFKLFVIFRCHFRSVRALRLRCRIVVVKITGVCGMPYLRYNRTFHLPVIECVPIDALEEWMGFDAIGSTRYVAKPIRRVHGTQSANEIFCLRGDTLRKAELTFYNSVQTLVSSLTNKI